MGKLERLLAPMKSPKSTTLGNAGYDNPRQNIDPHIVTKVIDATEIVLNGDRRTSWPTSGTGHTIEDEGTPLTARTSLNFSGAGVTAADIGGKTVVTIQGGGASALDDLTDVAITTPTTGNVVRYNGNEWVNYADSNYAASGAGVTNGNSHDHNGGDGAQIDHGGLGGLADDDHTQYVLKAGSITQITTRSHTSLSDIGTNSHATLDTNMHASGADISIGVGAVAQDHGASGADMVINVCYGISATPPTASTTTEGTLYLQYTP